MSLRSSTFDSRIGPKSVIVARTGTPVPRPPSARNSTGKPVGAHGVAGVRGPPGRSGRRASPGAARPDRSPLMSASTTGTPAADSCSAISCSVFVLPVPVAPAIRPCRFSIASGTRTWASGCGLPRRPLSRGSTAGPSARVPARRSGRRPRTDPYPAHGRPATVAGGAARAGPRRSLAAAGGRTSSSWLQLHVTGRHSGGSKLRPRWP